MLAGSAITFISLRTVEMIARFKIGRTSGSCCRCPPSEDFTTSAFGKTFKAFFALTVLVWLLYGTFALIENTYFNEMPSDALQDDDLHCAYVPFKFARITIILRKI